MKLALPTGPIWSLFLAKPLAMYCVQCVIVTQNLLCYLLKTHRTGEWPIATGYYQNQAYT